MDRATETDPRTQRAKSRTAKGNGGRSCIGAVGKMKGPRVVSADVITGTWQPHWRRWDEAQKPGTPRNNSYCISFISDYQRVAGHGRENFLEIPGSRPRPSEHSTRLGEHLMTLILTALLSVSRAWRLKMERDAGDADRNVFDIIQEMRVAVQPITAANDAESLEVTVTKGVCFFCLCTGISRPWQARAHPHEGAPGCWVFCCARLRTCGTDV